MSFGLRLRKPGLALASLMLVVGCGQGTGAERADSVEQPIFGGFPSPSTQDATVLVLRTGRGLFCTGVVVAPTLVLTARSCVFDLPDSTDEAFYVLCLPNNTGTPVLRALDPAEFEIDVGTGHRTPEARGVQFYAGDELDLCANDLVLIEVDTPLSPAPLALSLDVKQGPKPNDTGKLVGWGSEDHPLIPGKDRQQHEMRVLAVGPGAFDVPDGGQLDVIAGSFVTGEGGCFIDQGGPFISDETNAVIGILSEIEPADPNAKLSDGLSYCIGAHSLFRSLTAQSAWIRDAFARTKQVPWLEGHPPPAPLGQSCASPGDCASGICKSTTGGAQFCSQDCNSTACPDGLDCLGAPGERWCVPAQVPNSAQASASCGVVHTSPGRARGWYLLPLGFVLLQRRRLLKFTRSKPPASEIPS